MVFASRHGELARSAELLAQVAQGELPSPMGFSLSVLNAAPGVFGIARRDLFAATAISGGEATLFLALVEAAAQAHAAPEDVVLVAFADDRPPEVYREIVDEPRQPFALAVKLDARAPRQRVKLQWTSGGGSEDAMDAAVDFLACLRDGTAASWAGPGHTWRWERLDG